MAIFLFRLLKKISFLFGKKRKESLVVSYKLIGIKTKGVGKQDAPGGE